jgi:hypothetical protein
MERACSHCNAVVAPETNADWCPACGGAIIGLACQATSVYPPTPPPEVDHRGILLPRRHALGGIITPQ